MATFVVSSSGVGCTIYQSTNTKNYIEIPNGSISENAMKAIAYKMLHMTEG